MFSGVQAVVGSVPLIKYSVRDGQPEHESVPVRVQIDTLTRLFGVVKGVL